MFEHKIRQNFSGSATVNMGTLTTKENAVGMGGNPFQVVCQKWEESERGWGVRPDGYSLHKSDADRVRFIEAYWETMPNCAPDSYSRPDGTPYWSPVDPQTYDDVMQSAHGIRRHNSQYPGGGGTDGWVPMSGGGHGKR